MPKAKAASNEANKAVKDDSKISESSTNSAEKVEKTPDTSKSTKAKSSSQPLTMEDLLSSSDYQLKVPQTGDIVQGVVKSIAKKMVLIDIGGKTEGLVVDKEFSQAEDFIATLHEGDTVDAYVLEGQNITGQTILSLKRAVLDKKWDELTKLQTETATVTVHGTETNRGGMVVVYDGLRGFIPTSQFGREISSNLDKLRGKDFPVKVLEVDKEKNRLIFSERQVSEAGEIANAEVALGSIKEGQIAQGVITGIKPFGVFVAVEVPLPDGQMGVLEGLVHVSEVSWDRVENLNALFKKGQKVETRVLSVSKEHGKLTLSMKQLENDPWNSFAEKYPEGSTINGTVSRVVPFGVFITLVPGIDGLIHESKLTGEPYMAGDKVNVSVDSIDSAQRRVSLSPATTDIPLTYK